MHLSLARPLPTDLLGYQTRFNDLSLNELREPTPETQYGPIPIPDTRLELVRNLKYWLRTHPDELDRA